MSIRKASSIFIVHDAVSGRVRFSVGKLARNAKFKRFLELHLNSLPYVSAARASSTTGTVLILFSKEVPVGNLERKIRAILERFESRAQAAVQDACNGWARSTWHNRSVDKIVSMFKTSKESGISDREALRRLRNFGSNAMLNSSKRTGAGILANQFATVPVALLTTSAAISILSGGAFEAAVILSVVVANAAVGYVMEYESEKTLDMLATNGPARAEVIRDGRTETISIKDIVPGDLMVLSPGMTIPADGRLISAEYLFVDESALTGESDFVLKKPGQIAPQMSVLGDRLNMAYRGTLVISGKGVAIVVATGRQTEIGKIQLLVEETHSSPTPLQKQMAQLSKTLVRLSGIAGFGIFTVGLMRGHGLVEMLNMSISLIIAAVPEGLPTIATTTLTQSTQRMRKQNIVVRKLDAIETLGSTEIMCLDKTGTLTLNHLSPVAAFAGMKTYAVENGAIQGGADKDISRLIQCSCLCNETKINGTRNGEHSLEGSPTESALVELAFLADIDVKSLRKRFPLIKTEYRTEKKRYMVTEHAADEGSVVRAVKGTPLQVLDLCDYYLENGRKRLLTAEAKSRIQKANDEFASSALRVLGVAYAEGSTRSKAKDFVFLGLVGLADVPRPGVEKVIRAFHRAGIRTVMITGDQAPTAYAVARRLGLSGREPLAVFDASRIEEFDANHLKRVCNHVHVFARVSPSDKLKIIEALKASGKTVAMAGDGVNDAPALKAADVGIAMGKKGTDVARDVAKIVLLDDNLEILIRAVALGRATHGAIRKSVMYLLTTNLSEILLVAGSVTAGFGEPLNPVQLLWINMISDVFPALALALEPPERDVLRRPPEAHGAPLISKPSFSFVGKESAVMTGIALATYGYAVAKYGRGRQSQGLAFSVLAGEQLMHTFTSRTQRSLLNGGASRLRKNQYVPMAVAAGFGLQALTFLNERIQKLMGTAGLDRADLAVCVAGTIVDFVVNENIKQRSIHA